MRITIVGCATSIPEPTRRQSAVAVEAGGMFFLVDAGEGAACGLVACGLDRTKLDAVLLTHFHPDHTAGLAALLLAMRVHDRRERPLLIIGPSALPTLMAGLSAAYGPWIGEEGSHFVSIPVQPPGTKTWTGDPMLVYMVTDHLNPSIGWRIESQGKAAAVTGDSAPCKSLVDLAEKVDVLICEATALSDKPLPGHLTPRLAGELAAKAEAKRLVLTHLSPEVRDADPIAHAASAFSGEILLAEDGLVLEV